MGGRGQAYNGSRAGKTAQEKRQKPSYFSESEKAVSLKLRVEDFTLDNERTKTVWIPKSQLSENGIPGQWITDQKTQEFYSLNTNRLPPHESTWIDSNGNEYKAQYTAKEKERETARKNAMDQGKQSYNELIAEAKRLGIKGIRVGLKRKTIEDKIRNYRGA